MGMTIDEAIKLSETASQGFPIGKDQEKYYKALDLGREALINLRNQRTTGVAALDYRLPGETEK